jgi:hypothetical protein
MYELIRDLEQKLSKFREYNEYLFHEFNYKDEGYGHRISDTWPFTFHFLGRFNIDGTPTDIFEFEKEGVGFYLVDGSSLSLYEKSGLIRNSS